MATKCEKKWKLNQNDIVRNISVFQKCHWKVECQEAQKHGRNCLIMTEVTGDEYEI